MVSLVSGSANIVLPSTQRIWPLRLFTSCLISEISIEVLLSPHWEAGLVYLLTASYKDFESVMHMNGSRATSRCHSRADIVEVLGLQESIYDTSELIQDHVLVLGSLSSTC